MARVAKGSATKKTELTPFENVMLDALKKVKEYSLSAEANIVSILYMSPSKFYEYDLQIENFNSNAWKVYFAIAQDLVINEKKQVLDDVTVGLYLEKHSKLRQKYEDYGGYEVIENAKAYVKENNFDSYVLELRKWNVVLKMLKMKFPIADRLSELVDMSIEDIYREYDTKLNHLFASVDGGIKSYDITHGIDELIDELNEGLAVGLPFNNLPMLNKETGGMLIGNITLVGGLSNVGKSTFARTTLIPTILKYNEKIVIMLNEDGLKKWQREFLVWISNNILKKDLQKYIVRDGNYSEEVKNILKESADWLKEKAKDKTITIIPFESYSTDKAVKIIKKYASLGDVKYFLLDTFKMDAGDVNDQAWLQLQQNMMKIYDVVKPESKNLHIMITFQLNKSSSKQRYYTMDNIGGGGKNIIDCASTCIMVRNVMDDEYPGEKRAIQVYRLEGKNLKTRIPVHLDKDKKYQILFIVKNREGGTNYQIVVEHDMSRNMLKEVGVTSIEVDF